MTRLVITSHTPDGKSIISSDTRPEPFRPMGPQGTGFTVFHTSDVVPVSNQGEYVPATSGGIPRCSPSGTMFCTADFPPHLSTPMHRTESVDYSVVLSGSIWLTLDSGEETEFKTGEIIVLRGANHVWSNRSDVNCRMLAVLVGSEKVKLEDGTELEATRLGPPVPE